VLPGKSAPRLHRRLEIHACGLSDPWIRGFRARARPLLLSQRMMDTSLTGRRCRTRRSIPHHRGQLPRAIGGTVQYALENLGRILIRVDFDDGPSLMVLEQDIEFENERLTA